MAATYGQMRDQILMETNRLGNTIFVIEVQNALVAAVKELETEQLFINSKFDILPVGTDQFVIPLPSDFISVLNLILLDSQSRNLLYKVV